MQIADLSVRPEGFPDSRKKSALSFTFSLSPVASLHFPQSVVQAPIANFCERVDVRSRDVPLDTADSRPQFL